MATNDFLLADPLLVEVRLYTLGAGKFNIAEVQSKFKIGYRRACFLRDALIAEGIIDKGEIDGENWLLGSPIIQDRAADIEEVVGKLVNVAGPVGIKNFDDLAKASQIEKTVLMRLVIMAGIKSLSVTLGIR